MVQVLSGIITGGIVFFLAVAFLWKEVLTYNRNFCEIRRKFLEALGPNPKREVFGRIEDLKEVIGETRASYRIKRNAHMKNAILKFALIALILGLLGAYVAHLRVIHVYTATAVFPIPVLVTAVILCFVFILESEKICVHESMSASDLKLWLGVILPSVTRGGELRIVQGSMYPYPFCIKPFFSLLDWLRREKKVTIEFVSGEPNFSKMEVWQREEWKNFWSNIKDYGFEKNVSILQERPQLQFTLTNKLVRIEKDHCSWVERQRKQGDKLVEEPVTNHMHLFDYFLMWTLRDEFKSLYKSGKPVLELESFQTLNERANR